MKRILFSVLLIGLLSSCYHEVNNKVVIPERLLSEDSIVMVLTEIQLAEGAITLKRFSHILTDEEEEMYYDFVYRKFGLTPELLKENIDYYNSNPDKMIGIYDKVLENLMKIQAEITLEAEEVKKAKDDSVKLIDTTVYVRKSIIFSDDTSAKDMPW